MGKQERLIEVMHAETRVNLPAVRAQRGWRDAQEVRNLLVAVTLGIQLKHLMLAIGQWRELLHWQIAAQHTHQCRLLQREQDIAAGPGEIAGGRISQSLLWGGSFGGVGKTQRIPYVYPPNVTGIRQS